MIGGTGAKLSFSIIRKTSGCLIILALSSIQLFAAPNQKKYNPGEYYYTPPGMIVQIPNEKNPKEFTSELQGNARIIKVIDTNDTPSGRQVWAVPFEKNGKNYRQGAGLILITEPAKLISPTLFSNAAGELQVLGPQAEGFITLEAKDGSVICIDPQDPLQAKLPRSDLDDAQKEAAKILQAAAATKPASPATAPTSQAQVQTYQGVPLPIGLKESDIVEMNRKKQELATDLKWLRSLELDEGASGVRYVTAQDGRRFLQAYKVDKDLETVVQNFIEEQRAVAAEKELRRNDKTLTEAQIAESVAREEEARGLMKAARMEARPKLAAAKNRLLASIFDRIDKLYGTTDPKRVAQGEERANRLLVALTLFGEFRWPGQTGYFAYSHRTMKERAKSSVFENRRGVVYSDVMNEKGEDVLLNERDDDDRVTEQVRLRSWPAGAALWESQYSTWNTTDTSNLFAIVAQRDAGARDYSKEWLPAITREDLDPQSAGSMAKIRRDATALERIADFLVRDESGAVYETVTESSTKTAYMVVPDLRIPYYDSPASSPSVLNFDPTPLLPIRDRVTEEIFRVNRNILRGGYEKKRAKK